MSQTGDCPPHSIQCPLDLGLGGAEEICPCFGEEAGHEDVQPVVHVPVVDKDQLREGLHEDAEDLAVGVVEHSREDVRDFLQLATTVWKDVERER